MSSIIRPLTLAERKRPVQLMFTGGFKNVSFQIGEIVLAGSAEQNTNESTAVLSKAIIVKSSKVRFPIMVPRTVALLKGPSNTIATVSGQRNKYGGFDAILVARSTERMSSFNTKLRTVQDLVRTTESAPTVDETRLGTSSNARTHNQVMLAGVVVGARFEEGDVQRFHIDLRQDANPNNVIPLTFEARSASAMRTRVKYGALIYVDGEYAFRSIAINELDEKGNEKLDADGKPVPVLDAEGKPTKRIHTYIRITSPKDPAEFDTDFGNDPPRWIKEIAEQITASRTRSTAGKTEVSPDKEREVDIALDVDMDTL